MPAYFSSQIFALWLVVIASLLCSVKGDHVPGCGCDVSTCGYGSGARPSACDAFNWFYNASSILDQVGSPICDTVDAYDQFQDFYGRDRTTTYVWEGKGELEFYETGSASLRIGRGACESDVLPEQESCSITTDWITIASGILEPTGCSTINFNRVDNTTEFKVSFACQAWFDDEPVYGMNLRLQAVPLGTSADINLCSENTEQAAQQTLLTSDDWITPQPGRHYACKDLFTMVNPYLSLW